MVRLLLLMLALVLTTAAVRADEDADLKAFAAETESMYFPEVQTATNGVTPRLELSYKVTDADLAKLAVLKPKALKSLSLKFCDKVTPQGFASLGVLPSLTQLTIRQQFDDAALAELWKQVPNLEELWLQGALSKQAGPTEVGVTHLAKCNKLKLITFFSIPLTDKVWASLAKLANLEEVVIAAGGVGEITGAGIKDLKACKKLAKLAFLGTPVSEQGFKEVAELQTLTHLTLEETKIKDRDVARLASLKKLTYLNIDNEKLTDASLKSIGSMPALTTLAVMKVPFTDRGLIQLASAKSLREVVFNFTLVTDDGIKQLKKLLPQADIKKSK